MEVYIDRRTEKILRYIRRHPANRLADILDKFQTEDDKLGQTIINLCMADYLVCKHSDQSMTQFKDGPPWDQRWDDNLWISPKGRKLLEDRFDRFWQWSIPTIISVIALVISVLSA